MQMAHLDQVKRKNSHDIDFQLPSEVINVGPMPQAISKVKQENQIEI
jgi:hypothetical protein